MREREVKDCFWLLLEKEKTECLKEREGEKDATSRE